MASIPGSHAGNEASEQLEAVMARPMQSQGMSGILDRDFATMMAEHHQGAIDMARIQLQHGKSPELRAMAQQMIQSQSTEMNQLLQLAGQATPQGGASGATELEAAHHMHGMMAPMSGMQMSGDVDRDFAMLMAHHHQSGIDMAKMYASHGKNPAMLTLAQKIIADQTREKAVLMQHAQMSHGAAGSAMGTPPPATSMDHSGH